MFISQDMGKGSLSIIDNQYKEFKLSSLVYSIWYPDNQVLLLVYSISYHLAQ